MLSVATRIRAVARGELDCARGPRRAQPRTRLGRPVRSRWLALCALFALDLGCSSEPQEQRGPQVRAGSSAVPSAGAGGNGGSAGRSGSADNPNGAPRPTLPELDAAIVTSDEDGGSEDCDAGMFCEARGPDGDCGSERVETDTKTVQKPGNALVIYDRSGSMDADWNGQPKYQAAGNAIIAALDPLKSLLTIGGVFFPSVDPASCICQVANPLHWIPGPGACCLNGIENSCFVSDIAQTDQFNFATAESYITALPNLWRLEMSAGTPLQAGIQRGAEALASTQLDGPVVVIVMTDGEPNCDTDPQFVLDQVTTWRSAGIDTHVIGLPGAQEAADLLNQLAMAGGTGQYVDPSNAMELETRLRTILTSTIRAGFDSCTFPLDKKTEVPEKLHLVIREDGKDKDVPRDLSADPAWGEDAGWTINAEGDTVELTGRLCELAKNGAYEALRFNYGCIDLPPPDPPIGPM
jgi:von Willebrand factor type A domain